MTTRTAVFSGSFNPWHEGHTSILEQALLMFDKVIVCRGINPEKDLANLSELPAWIDNSDERIDVMEHSGLMVDFVRHLQNEGEPVVAMIRGIRNFQDMEYERITQYHNEDLGINVPTIYLIADRNHVHISSSAIRTIEKLRNK